MFYLIESKAYLNEKIKKPELDIEGLKVKYEHYDGLKLHSYEFDDMYQSNVLLWGKLFSNRELKSITVKIDSLDEDVIIVVLGHNGGYQYDENGSVIFSFQIHENNEVIIKLMHSCHPSKLILSYCENYKNNNDNESQYENSNTDIERIINEIQFYNVIPNKKNRLIIFFVITVLTLILYIILWYVSSNILVNEILMLAMFTILIVFVTICAAKDIVKLLIKKRKMKKLHEKA